MTALDLGYADRVLTPPSAAFETVAWGDIALTPDSAPHPVEAFVADRHAIPRFSADGASTLRGATQTPAINFAAFIAVKGPSTGSGDWTVMYTGAFDLGLAHGAVSWAYAHPYGAAITTGLSLSTPHDDGVTVYALVNNGTESFLANSRDGLLATAARKTSVTPRSTVVETSYVSADDGVLGVWYFDGDDVSQADALDTLDAIEALFATPDAVSFAAAGRVNISGTTALFTTDDLYEETEVVLPAPGGSVTPPEPPAPPTPPDYAPEPIRHVWQDLSAPSVNADGFDPDWMPDDEDYAPFARWQIAVEGVDVTYYLGASTPEPDWTDADYGFGPATLRFPQVTVFTPMPSWARGGANVVARLVRVSDLSTITAYEGLVLRDGARFEGGHLTLECTGYLYAVDLQLRLPAGNTKPLDVGTAIPRAINKATSRRYNTMGSVVTGIKTSVAGGWEPLLTGYVANILATAVDKGRQWTVKMWGRTPQLVRKDTTTVHLEVRAGQAAVKIDLGSDAAEAQNVILGEGINPDHGAWSNWQYPYFRPDDTPPYPNTDPGNTIRVGTSDADTDTGKGVSDYQRKAGMPVTGTFSSANKAETKRQQRDMGILDDGIPGPQTWAATFRTGSNTGSLDGAFIKPLAASTKVTPRLYGPDGDDLGLNPAYDPNVLVVHRKIDYGTGVWRYDAKKNAREILARDSDPGLAGTITFEGVDPEQMHRYLIRAGMNILVKGWRGADVVAHIVSVSKSGKNVALSVDTKARDWPTLKAILERQRESTDPARTARLRLLEGKVGSDRPIFDAESPGGTIPRHAIFGGLWNVLKIAVGAENGDMARTWFTTSDPPQAFSVAAFGKPVTANQIDARVGNPLAAEDNPWEDDTLDTDLGLLNAWGWTEQQMGWFPRSYSNPKSKGAYPVTGRMVDDGLWPFANSGGYLYIALFVASPGYIEGRLRPTASR